MKIAEVRVSGCRCETVRLEPIPRGIVGAVVAVEYTDPAWDSLRKDVYKRQALASRSGIRAVSPLSRKLAQSRSSPELLNAVQCLQKAVDYTTGNVSPAAVCGWLEWALR